MKKIIVIFLCLLQWQCGSKVVKKMNGVSFVATREKAVQENVELLKELHATHAAIMPFGFIRELNSPDIIYNTERQWYGETKEGVLQYIRLLHKNRIKVMLKPQIWIWRGEFTGNMKMTSEEDWQRLEKSYEDFILTYASVAEESGVEIFCVGTELEQFVQNRPGFWDQLIIKIRDIYKGKLTYAANWDEYGRVPFWSSLDYIGVDAYFPLSEKKTPSTEELRRGWQPWKEKLRALSLEHRKKVLFTEFGYRSMDYTAHKPWLVDRTEEGVNLQAQVNAKNAIFEEFWREDWFAGGFVWKWFPGHENAGGSSDNRFTPQNKPAEAVIRSYYKAY
ncbi:glycoside hydrolase TIM-barrel-like domain-containing protein [Zeaxanthinibacter sp. PT1]|uniref:glycoside hydrolase family 113 n=1 Tax=Zeaxanthinibacter TaxID=561554 RepID=UPI00234BD7D2|nr:glycoside hydrolase TIM-barrel-like domain-containing protein [Zeaxanthinibacter sp. PT1]MDC6351207.1 glycoside hydrolase TIM-barrel-like domain-containing protein [Zeaxanthinibacter sp. PT1]